MYYIFLIGVSCTDEPLLFFYFYHSQSSNQHDDCLLLVDTITCLQTLRGNHRKFVITVEKCKCSILQLVQLRFD